MQRFFTNWVILLPKPSLACQGIAQLTPKCQVAGVGRRKSLKIIYQMIPCSHDNLEATVWRVFAMRERANLRSEKNSVAVVCTNSHSNKKQSAMRNRNLHECIHLSFFAQLFFGYLCNWETHQSWKNMETHQIQTGNLWT